jgi:steroid 5-alpha reductase family enzyme
MSDILLWNAGAVGILMMTMWLISIARRDASIVDIIWGMGFVVIAWVTWFRAPLENRSLLLPVLMTIWGVRLSIHLGTRNIGKPEDFRYAAMRQKHGDRFWLVSLYTVFLLQGTIMWVVALPVQMSAVAEPKTTWMTILGCGLWLIGLFFETVGDIQLTGFRANPENAGKVLNHGLWRFTRHPNYFGDFCVWWGVYLIGISCGAPVWTMVGPAVMSIFLLRISGVTLLEKTLVAKRPAYVEYVQETNAFFPGPVRRRNSAE